MEQIIKLVLLATVFLLSSGCAVYYHDKETGADHVWGFGHLATKIDTSKNGKQAVIRKTTLMGMALGYTDDSVGISLGWDQRERFTVLSEDASVFLERPQNDDFFQFKFGTQPFDGRP